MFPLVSVRDLNNLERKFLEVLNYNVGMKVRKEKKKKKSSFVFVMTSVSRQANTPSTTLTCASLRRKESLSL